MIYLDAYFSFRRWSIAGYVNEDERKGALKKHKRLYNTYKNDSYS